MTRPIILICEFTSQDCYLLFIIARSLSETMDADVPCLECAVVQTNGEFPSPKSWCEVVDIELCRRIYYSHPGSGLIFNFKNHEGIKFVCVWDGEATHADDTRLWQFSAFRKDRSLALRTVYVRQVPQAGLHGASVQVGNTRWSRGQQLRDEFYQHVRKLAWKGCPWTGHAAAPRQRAVRPAPRVGL